MNSAPGFIRAWRAKGYSVTLSPPEPSGCSRAALVSSLPFRPFRLPDGLANQRCAAGLFDFRARPAKPLSLLPVISILSPRRLYWGRPLLLVPSVPLTMRPKVHLCQPQVRGESAELIMGYVTGRLLLARLTVLMFLSRTTLRLPMMFLLMRLHSCRCLRGVRPPTLPRKTFNYSLRLPTLVLFGVQSRRLTLTQLGRSFRILLSSVYAPPPPILPKESHLDTSFGVYRLKPQARGLCCCEGT